MTSQGALSPAFPASALISSLEAPAPSRSPWQLLYQGAHGLRRRWYRARAKSLPRPVISVGNLHWGGVGKTPLVAALAAHLRDRGLQVSILSRGYASRGHGVRVVSTGDGPILGPLVAGDEPVLLAGEVHGVSVVVSKDRHAGGVHALERIEPAPEIFLLDDGFSHLKLHRDLDLLAFPASDPFGGGRLPPGGRLREPLASAERAAAAILTVPDPAPGADAVEASPSEDPGSELAAALSPYGFSGPGFASRMRVGKPRLDRVRPVPEGSPVLLVSAIARPQRFQRAARASGVEVVGELTFPDHHRYPKRSLERILQARRSCGARYVLTTTKDRVKLHGRLDAPLAELPVWAQPEPGFWSWFDGRVDALLSDLGHSETD